MLLPILFHDGGKSITSRKNMPAARAGKGGKATAKGAGKTAKGVKSLTQKIADFCVSHKTALLWVWQ